MKTSILFACFFLSVSCFSYAQSMAFSGHSAPVEKKKKPEEKAVPLYLQSRSPEFPGGQEGLDQYIKSNLSYPALAEQHSREGTVIVQFQVDKTGKISGIAAENTIGMGCEEAAIELVKNMPNWKPAMQGGRYIPSRVSVPVQFRLY